MFGISFSELLIILLVAFILIGPEKLPKFARGLGRGLKELKKFSYTLTNSIKEEMNEVIDQELVDDIKKAKNLKTELKNEVSDQLKDVVPEDLQDVSKTVREVKQAVNPTELKKKVKDSVLSETGRDEISKVADDFKK